MSRRLPAWALLPLLTLVLALGACRREGEDATLAAPGDPVGAIQAQARALRANDLAAYGRLSLPPELYARTVARWDEEVARAEPVDPADAAEYDEMMSRLLADDAEQALLRDLEPKLQQFESEMAGQWPMMQATAGIFLTAAIQANEDLSEADKAHGSELVSGLLAWAQPALFTDRDRARAAVAAAVGTARELQLPTLADARALKHGEAMAKGGIALAGAKAVAKAYDLDLDAALDGVQAELVSSEGDQATVKVSYPLLGKTIAFEQRMVRVGEGWYSADAVREAEQALAEVDAGADGATGVATDAPAGEPADAAAEAASAD